MTPERSSGSGHFSERPILVFWETTRSCPLACRHCRAEAMLGRDAGELDTGEAKALVDDLVSGFRRPPVLILSGGDPLMRPDLEEIVGYATSRGVATALSPAVSPGLSRERMRGLAEAGARSVSISLDGIGETHDGVRGVEGHFARTVEAIQMLKELGYRVQVNTTVMRENAAELARVANLLLEIGVGVWEVFFLVEVGRGSVLRSLSPGENEDVSAFLCEASPYFRALRTVEGPFYRRVVAGARGDTGELYRRLVAEFHGGDRVHDRPPRGAQTRDGSGVIFISHLGEVFPSGFLPLKIGQVREKTIGEIYRDNDLLQAIRAGDLGGRCGVCDFSAICGGSRARAYASSGDPLGEDPACGYLPKLPVMLA